MIPAGAILRRLALKLIREQSGQAIVLTAFMITALVGIVGLTVDVGHMMYCHAQLQASTDAAALAGGQALPSTAATTAATHYSSVSGGWNVASDLPNVSMVSGYPKLECLNTLKALGVACSSPSNANAIQVVQTMNVPTYFMALFGHKTMPITTEATAAMRGSTATPYNVIIVVDTTSSMNNLDLDSQCLTTRIACALSGVQVLLNNLSPCSALINLCGTVTSGNVTGAIDKVSIFTFPGVTAGTAADDYNCSGKLPTISAYTYPTLPTYQIVPFSSDYRASDTTSILSQTSSIVAAAGGKSLCTGLSAVGGAGTYYAGVIYAAQAQLAASSVTGTQNVMIILSDGDASSTNMTSTNTKGTYPSSVDQCQQAITAAAAASSAGTHVYTVAYGATSSGCSTDKGALTPCQTMQQMASAPQYFFSDYTATQGGGGCVSAAQPTSNLNQIFTQIAGDFTVPRLIPDNTT
jgi:Flp pilus assembly protein TadG